MWSSTPARIRAQVTIRYRDQEIRVEVIDDGRGVAAPTGDGRARVGHGLIGMRERVAVFGGDLETGPARTGLSGRRSVALAAERR